MVSCAVLLTSSLKSSHKVSLPTDKIALDMVPCPLRLLFDLSLSQRIRWRGAVLIPVRMCSVINLRKMFYVTKERL